MSLQVDLMSEGHSGSRGRGEGALTHKVARTETAQDRNTRAAGRLKGSPSPGPSPALPPENLGPEKGRGCWAQARAQGSLPHTAHSRRQWGGSDSQIPLLPEKASEREVGVGGCDRTLRNRVSSLVPSREADTQECLHQHILAP